jgi:hypothetical protein
MRNFEQFLTGLSKPDVDVPAFRERLGRELASVAAGPRPSGRLHPAMALTASVAAACAVVTVWFVAQPSVPAAIHDALAGRPAVADGAAEWQNPVPVEADHAFVQDWAQRKGQSVDVQAVESERLYGVRQLELTDGTRMLVFTELEPDGAMPAAIPTIAANNLF